MTQENQNNQSKPATQALSDPTGSTRKLFDVRQNGWGHSIEKQWGQSDQKKIQGCLMPLPEIGDYVIAKSGDIARFVEVKPMGTPKDAFFGEVEWIGWAVEPSENPTATEIDELLSRKEAREVEAGGTYKVAGGLSAYYGTTERLIGLKVMGSHKNAGVPKEGAIVEEAGNPNSVRIKFVDDSGSIGNRGLADLELFSSNDKISGCEPTDLD